MLKDRDVQVRQNIPPPVGGSNAKPSKTRPCLCTHASGKPMRHISVMLFVLISGHLKSQTVNAVLDKYFMAVGTKDKWNEVHSRIDRIETIRVADMSNHHKPLQTFKEEITYKFSKRKDSIVWDRFVSVSKNSLGDTSTSCFNGTNYWIQKSREKVNDFDFYSSRYAKFSNLGHPDHLLRVDKYDFIGSKTIDGTPCYVIRVTVADMESDYYFDKKTGYLILYHQVGKDLQTKLSDYRNVNGLMIPFKEELNNKYGFVSSKITTEVRINPSINDDYFSKKISLGQLLE